MDSFTQANKHLKDNRTKCRLEDVLCLPIEGRKALGYKSKECSYFRIKLMLNGMNKSLGFFWIFQNFFLFII